MAGRLLKVILAGVSEYEGEVIRERIKAGIAKAKAQGKRWGGRQVGHRTRLTGKKLTAVDALLKEGTAKAEIARQLNISERSVYRAVELIARS